MRRIGSDVDSEKNQKRNGLIIGIIFIVILLFSTAGFSLYSGGSSSQNANPQQDIGPVFNGNYWVYTQAGQEFYFSEKLEESENTEVLITNTLGDYSGKTLYIDSKNPEATNLIGLNLGRYSSRVQQGCYGSCEEDFPEINCDGSQTENLIVYSETNTNYVKQENNCILIDGDLKFLDAFHSKILGFS